MRVIGCTFSLLAAVSFALYTILGKRIMARNDPLLAATLALFSGAVLLAVFTSLTSGFRQLASADTAQWGLMLLLGLTMIGIASPIWFTCLKRLPASRVSVYIYLTPVFAVILSLAILNERFSWLFWLGGGLVLGGIIIARRNR